VRWDLKPAITFLLTFYCPSLWSSPTLLANGCPPQEIGSLPACSTVLRSRRYECSRRSIVVAVHSRDCWVSIIHAAVVNCR